MGVHVRKGSGKAIDGTFVADAMGGVDAGLNATIAAEFATGSNFRFTLDARGVVASQLSTVSLRGGLMYRFAGR